MIKETMMIDTLINLGLIWMGSMVLITAAGQLAIYVIRYMRNR